MDVNRHKFYMLQILKDIYSDSVLSTALGFKGGTALMFFYNLPRFSVDLDFNLLASDREKQVFEAVRNILLHYGKIHDEAMKFYGSVLVLDYGVGERKLKVEVSNRLYQNPNHYEVRNMLGINMKVMTESDMFAHKLCALLDREDTTNRDIFDCWFFLNRHTPINKKIVEERMQMPLADYVGKCIKHLQSLPEKSLLDGLGELTTSEIKKFVRLSLRSEIISLMQIFQTFPLVAAN